MCVRCVSGCGRQCIFPLCLYAITNRGIMCAQLALKRDTSFKLGHFLAVRVS